MTTPTKRRAGKPATAPAVSRALRDGGMNKATAHASKRVRGWWTYYAGYVVRTTSTAGQSMVTWQFGDGFNGSTMMTSAREMDRAARILRMKGYTAEAHVSKFSGETYLLVTRRDESGEVIA